ncbi:MAG: hypothetical protein ACRCV3_02605 [Desulfovibrionaceae bacterium]
MLEKKIEELCKNLDIPVPNALQNSEYFFSFEDSVFMVVEKYHTRILVWSTITPLSGDESKYSEMLTAIGKKSALLLSGISASFFPIIFIENHEMRWALLIEESSNKKLIEVATLLVEEVHLWRERLQVMPRILDPMMTRAMRF